MFKNDTKAVTPVLGVLLLLPTMMIGLVAFQAYMDAQTDWASAEAEKARFMAECARAWTTEDVEPDPGCPGVDDQEVEAETCTKVLGECVKAECSARKGAVQWSIDGFCQRTRK